MLIAHKCEYADYHTMTLGSSVTPQNSDQSTMEPVSPSSVICSGSSSRMCSKTDVPKIVDKFVCASACKFAFNCNTLRESSSRSKAAAGGAATGALAFGCRLAGMSAKVKAVYEWEV